MSEVSVIVPSYNQAPFISDCISSILTQTKKPHEIIVVDDASTDNTVEVIKPYFTKIKFILNRKNFGAFSFTSNIGIKQATGDYILIVSADDWLAPTILEEEAAILDKNPEIALVYSQAFDVVNGEKILKMPKPAGNESYIGRDNDFQLLLTKGDFIPSINALVRRVVYKKVGLFDTNLRYMADYEMWIRIAKSYPLAYIAKPLTYYRVHGKNLHLNTDFQTRNEFELKYILEKYLTHKKIDESLTETKKISFYNYYLKVSTNAVFNRNFKKAYAFWLKAAKTNPKSIQTWQTAQPVYFLVREFLKKVYRNISTIKFLYCL